MAHTQGTAWPPPVPGAETTIALLLLLCPYMANHVMNRWRSPENEWRKFGVPALPTLYKVSPDGVSCCCLPSLPDTNLSPDLTVSQTWSQLVEGEVYDQKKLDAFVGTQ